MSKINGANANPSQSPDPGRPLLVPSIGTGIVFLSDRRSFLSEPQDAGCIRESRFTAVSFSSLVSHSLWPLRVIGSSGWRWNSRGRLSSNT